MNVEVKRSANQALQWLGVWMPWETKETGVTGARLADLCADLLRHLEELQ